MEKLQKSYFLQKDVVFLAKDLLGKHIFTCIDGQITGGIISETEAYVAEVDKASHAYNHRRTKRNEMMYHEGGVVYMYICYGMHHMLNIVTNEEDVADAILIRGIIPTHGEELILKRTGKTHITSSVTSGPGKVSKALGLTIADNGTPLDSEKVWLEDRGEAVSEEEIQATPRIGVDYAGEDAKLPYRFVLKRS
ncbi:MAG: DNA-3-methyladenine glycosylase [Bacteroidales bacterium]|nr:DNA-3-methyladenine glycosylase [Bacteroidales bacterium]